MFLVKTDEKGNKQKDNGNRNYTSDGKIQLWCLLLFLLCILFQFVNTWRDDFLEIKLLVIIW